nr:hypothetical protein [Tanacetum cinerariifolium]
MIGLIAVMLLIVVADNDDNLGWAITPSVSVVYCLDWLPICLISRFRSALEVRHRYIELFAGCLLTRKVVVVPPAVTNKAAAPSLPVPKKKPPVPVKRPAKPPHPDTKYLSQILSVPKPDQLCSDDDLE